jgi:hypothetical protein
LSGQYPTPVDDVFVGLSVDATTCGCSCGAVTGVTCPSSAVLIERDNCTQFLFDPDTQAVGSDCVRVNAPVTWPAFTTSASPDLSSAQCTATATESFPDPEWANLARTCSGAAGDACEAEGECVDAGGDFADVCIYQNGDLSCPGECPVKVLGRDGFSDTRDCADTCACTDPQAACPGTVSFYSESEDTGFPTCPGAVQATRNVGTCADSPEISNPSARYTPAGFVSQGCTASTPAPTGLVTPDGATTICCLS